MAKSEVSIGGVRFCITTRKAKSPSCFIVKEDYLKQFERRKREKPRNIEILNDYYDELVVKMDHPGFDFKKWLEEKESGRS